MNWMWIANRKTIVRTLVLSAVASLGATSSSVWAQEVVPVADPLLEKSASWNWPDLRLLQEQWSSYLDLAQIPAERRAEAEKVWQSVQQEDRGPAVLDRLLETASIVDARVATTLQKLNEVRGGKEAFQAVDLSWFDSKVPGWLQENLKLAVARSYAQAAYYDEALHLLEPLSDSAVVDPSTAMFYRAVCYHGLMSKEKCVSQVDSLLRRENEIPTRYVITAKLIQSDLQSFEPDSLDEVARLMTDVERRLDLGRAGKKVRTEEKDIVDKLDKLIDDIEKQIQEQQQQQKKASEKDSKPKNGTSKPMDDSRIAGGSGPGDVDPKKLENKGNWGDLPPAQRQESLQNITRDLPSHYREVIEAYFKKLGTGDK